MHMVLEMTPEHLTTSRGSGVKDVLALVTGVCDAIDERLVLDPAPVPRNPDQISWARTFASPSDPLRAGLVTRFKNNARQLITGDCNCAIVDPVKEALRIVVEPGQVERLTSTEQKVCVKS